MQSGSESYPFTQGDKDSVQSSVRIHSWDWRGRPDIGALNRDLFELYDGMHCPYMAEVPDSRGDGYVVFVTSRFIEPDVAQRLWDEWDFEIEERGGKC